MIENKTQRLTLSGLLLALGIILPYATAHGLGVAGSRKRVEHIRFGSADFPLYFADFFLNIRIFLKKIGSSMKKSATSKLLRTIRRINFRLILSDFDEVKCGLY